MDVTERLSLSLVVLSEEGVCSTLLFVPNILFLLQALQKWQLGFLASLYILSVILPQLPMQAVTFGPIRCILSLVYLLLTPLHSTQ